ncbi:hypothetical protein ElyMa_004742500 [Elysia marginata]|uniref:Uncharacterized protein n=1 Tax=Elysia marginata TaxID=1093978 RepID=A0AAV4IBK8_9GAST|nr:hypothetical protein ElyMa_004742500 [Elysia marginata]
MIGSQLTNDNTVLSQQKAPIVPATLASLTLVKAQVLRQHQRNQQIRPPQATVMFCLQLVSSPQGQRGLSSFVVRPSFLSLTVLSC